MSTITRKATLGALAALLASTALVASADAHGFKHRNRILLQLGHAEDCGYYKWMWFKTGKMFWKWKYFECRSIY